MAYDLVILIKTLLKNLISVLTPKNDKAGVFVLMIMAILLIAVRGSVSEGQQGLLGMILNRYVEETTAAVISYPSQYQLAEINSLGSPVQAKPATTSGTIYLSSLRDNSMISSDSQFGSTSDASSEQANQPTEYEVQEGDSLSTIASDYNVTINSIIWSNNLKNADSIRQGMILRIPPVSGIIYKVKAGDTIGSIAKQFSGNTQEILSFNKLDNDQSLVIGQELIIPNGTPGTTNKTNNKSVIVINDAKRFAHLPILAGYFGAPAIGMDWGIIHGRNGVDVANSCGTPIHASADGVVKLVKNDGWNGGYGHYIVLTHPNGTETLYAHTMKNLVATIGEAVTKGEQIALMGTTGHSTGCHVHFEVHGAANPMAK